METIIDRMTDEVLKDEYFSSLFEKCTAINALQTINRDNVPAFLSTKEFKDLLRFADILSNSRSSEGRNKAYQIITFLNKTYSNHEVYRTVSKAIYSKLGNFPALKYLENVNQNIAIIPANRFVEMEAKRLLQTVPESDKIFTDVQYELYSLLSSSLKYSFSGPTSMGKSFIIKAFIRKAVQNSPPENLVIVVPTRALINQFTIDLKEELEDVIDRFKYKVVTNSNINDLLHEEHFNYILVLTPERLISYLSQPANPTIGFLFVDEAHKLAQNKDSRSITTYTAIEKAVQKYGSNLKLYFSSPNVANPQVFLSLFLKNADHNSFRTDESPVSQNLYFIDMLSHKVELIQGNDFKEIQVENFEDKFASINSVVHYLGKDENNLIYNSSKPKTIKGAKEFAENLPLISQNALSEKIRLAIEQIKDYVHPDYYLAELLSKKVAYHHGKLPQLIRNIVEDLYKNDEVRHVFCTSTLLEGVNMPTKNLFILANKNGSSELEDIDFWNLTGRAGRLTKELFGNIYCIKHSGCLWDNKDSILIRKPINLKPTILNKIDSNLRRIENVLNEKDISGTETEKEILKYIANIICIDTLTIKDNYVSPLIEKLIENKKEKIIELAKKKTEGISVPFNILSSNQSIQVSRQQRIFAALLARHEKKIAITLPSTQSENFYKVCKEVLEHMYDLYEWDKAEKKLHSKESIKYYATIMNQWIKGFSLSQIISQSIDYNHEKKKTIAVDYNDFEVFNKKSLLHVNILIENIIDDIEHILRFLFEKYFNHYHQIVVSILGEDQAGENWAVLLEYGTQNRIVIALQNIGLSRHTAIAIYNKCRSALTIKDSKLISVNKPAVLKEFKKSSIEYREISSML